MAEQTPSEPATGGVYIPLWIALAGMVLALIVAVVIMANVLEPLVNLVFPSDPEPPLPPDAVELDRVENPTTSTGEWLYGSDMHGCEIAQFYIDNGSTCRLTPLACEPQDGVLQPSETRVSGVESIASCTGSEGGVVDSYSWEVLISSGYSDYTTKFRVYLYAER